MRKYQHLDLLINNHNETVDKAAFAALLIDDLKQSCCLIYGKTDDEQPVLLAELTTQTDSLHLHTGFLHQRIEFVVRGKIINEQYPPLTYSVKGSTCGFHGRCSTIPQICGVDLYLDKSYTEKVGDEVKQKFTMPVNKLFRSLKYKND